MDHMEPPKLTYKLSLRFVLEKDKISPTNFLDWSENLKKFSDNLRKIMCLRTPFPRASYHSQKCS